MSENGPRRFFLVLHGLGNHRPRGHWQWWLTQQLRQLGEQVLYPQLPDPDVPDLGRWLDILAAEYDQMGPRERIVICHSLGCALWHEASLRRFAQPPADRVLLVAPPGRSTLTRPITKEFDPGPWDAAALATSCRTKIRLVASDRDPCCTEGPAAVIYGLPLGLRAETIYGAGHLSTRDGYGPWPQALAWCLDSHTSLAAPSPRR